MSIKSARPALAASILLGLACAATVLPDLPPIEPWGDLEHPFDDAVEAAAWAALGPRPPDLAFSNFEPLRLAELWQTDYTERRMRASEAAGLLLAWDTYRRSSQQDSLPFVLEAIRVDPSFTRAYREAARVLLNRGALDRAHALAVQGLRLDSSDGILWSALASIYSRREDEARARVALDRALQIDGDKVPHGYEKLAVEFLRAGDIASADSVLRLQSHPDPSLQFYLEGLQARARGDLQAARSALERGARDPEAEAAMLVDWGNVEYELGHLDAAAGAFERALRAAPGVSAALTGRALVQRARGDLDAAVASFAQLVAQRPHDSRAQFNLAGASLDAAQRAGHGARADSLYAIAEKAFSACIEMSFHRSESLQRRAHVRLRLANAPGAAADARALLADPTHAAAAHLLLARAALASGDLQGVVSTLAPRFEADSLSSDGLDILGNTYLKLDRPRDAARVLGRAHQRQPAEWKTAMNLSVALSRSGDLPTAESILRDLAAQRPRDPDVLQNLAAVLQRRGRRAEADRLLRRAAELRSP